jgi:hypothetical protein
MTINTSFPLQFLFNFIARYLLQTLLLLSCHVAQRWYGRVGHCLRALCACLTLVHQIGNGRAGHLLNERKIRMTHVVRNCR